MKNYEKITFNETLLKQPTVYFVLKSNNFSERFIKNLRNASESILVNNSPANLNTVINQNDCIEILSNPKQKSNIALCDGNLDIVFENDDFLIVNKPHNLACMPSRSHFYDNLGGQICNYMQNKDNNFVLRIINRLDKETAGLVVVAKNLYAYSNISNIQKEYHALCIGNFEKEFFTISAPILTETINGVNNMKRIVSSNGKPAITKIFVEQNFDNYSLIKCILETGRTHQIRVHMSSIGHSLIGDTIYSDTQDLKENPNHTMLVLNKISFTNFRNSKTLTFTIPFPDEWSNFVHQNI